MPRIIIKILLICTYFVLYNTALSTEKLLPLSNQLVNHASPYLAMHGSDPVLWQQWNAATVARAKRENKLLYVSSGYFSCHWCHVMQRESYKNAEIAKIVNANFIPVKVDRELNPALDARLIDYAERTNGHAGWPLNVFVTAEGYPLVAMTYVPALEFKQILIKIKTKWRNEKQQLKGFAKLAAAELATTPIKHDANIQPDKAKEYIQRLLVNLFDYADELQGGFGNSMKFPSAPQLSLLLSIQQHQPNPRLEKFLRLTLNQMLSQGLWDHIGGGFYRYVVDPAWKIPHFEKMLYNNALLANIYFDAAKILKVTAYKEAALATLDFMMRDLKTTTGALAASLSSVDNLGHEGGFYLWQQQQIRSLLTKNEFLVVNLLWDLQRNPDIDNGLHLSQLMSYADIAQQLKMSEKLVIKYFVSARKKLFTARNKRHLPKDDKQLAAWNGLALSAFVTGIRNSDNDRYKQQALKIKNYIENKLWDGKSLYRAVNNNSKLGIAGLEDYAYVANGLYDWAQYTGKQSDLLVVHKIVTQAWSRFYGDHGWLLSENMLLKYGQGEIMISDGPMPSPSSMLATISLKLAKNTKHKKLQQRALASLNISDNELTLQPFWYATHIAALTQYQLQW